MSRPLLEVIALTSEDAVAAERGGADRLELVAEMAADGLTPATDTFHAVRDAVTIPVRVMLRLRDGFAAGDGADRERLCARAAELRAAGADEFVLGFLDGHGEADLPAVTEVTAAAGSGTRWTFHRAIDRAADRARLRTRLDGLAGLDTYLTAGSPDGVDGGVPVLTAEAARTAAGEPGYTARVMVGGGLRVDHLPALRGAGLDAFHIGGAARPHGWAGPVSADAVRTWREVLDSDG